MASKSIELFNEIHLDRLFQAVTAKAEGVLLSLPEDHLRKLNDRDDWLAQMLDQYTLLPVHIDFDNAALSHREAEIPAERFPQFNFHVVPGNRYRKPVIKFHIPYSGQEELLRCSANLGLGAAYADCHLEDGNITFEIIDFYEDAREVKPEFDRRRKKIESECHQVNEKVATFNERFPDQLRKTIAHRLATLESRRKAVEGLGFPIRDKEEVSTSSFQTASPPHSVSRKPVTRQTDDKWDVFVSHASEDKDPFVRSLADLLKAEGLRVWYDEFTLQIGDSLRRTIDRGLANSRFGVVVLSPSFFAKEWPQRELDGLSTRENNGAKVILPVWLGKALSYVGGQASGTGIPGR